jgi:hypothetical protein
MQTISFAGFVSEKVPEVSKLLSVTFIFSLLSSKRKEAYEITTPVRLCVTPNNFRTNWFMQLSREAMPLRVTSTPHFLNLFTHYQGVHSSVLAKVLSYSVPWLTYAK